MNWLHVVRKVRACENEAVAQLYLESVIHRAEPTGWKLAPTEPTQEMLADGVSKALRVKLGSDYHWPEYIADLWRSMLAAAPEPPSNAALSGQPHETLTGDTTSPVGPL